MRSDGSSGTEEHIEKPCNTHQCPVDGKWSAWREYGLCTKRCGGGKQQRKRLCDNPPPQGKGSKCLMSDGNGNIGTRVGMIEIQSRTCNIMLCDSSFWNSITLASGRTEIKERMKLHGPITMQKQFRVDFQVMVTHTTVLHESNVMHFIRGTTSGATRNVLGVWFKGETLIVRSQVNGREVEFISFDPILKNQWTNISITQKEEFGRHAFTINISGLREFSAINRRAEVVNDVNVWASNWWEESQTGFIQNLTYFFP